MSRSNVPLPEIHADVWGSLRRTMKTKQRPSKWVKASEKAPSKEGAYYTRFEEFKGEVSITYYTITSKGGYWSSMYKPTYWSEAVEK